MQRCLRSSTNNEITTTQKSDFFFCSFNYVFSFINYISFINDIISGGIKLLNLYIKNRILENTEGQTYENISLMSVNSLVETQWFLFLYPAHH